MNSYDEFKEIIETVNDVLLFLSVTNAVFLNEEDIKTIFYKSGYIEQFVFFLKNKNLLDVFEIKMKEYFIMKGKDVIPTMSYLELVSDEVLSKILTLQPPPHLFRVTINQYFHYCSYKRFENLIKTLSTFQALFTDVAKHLEEVLSPSEVESVWMFEFLRKLTDSGEDNVNLIHIVLKKMFSEESGIKTLVVMLCLDTIDDYFTIQKSLVEKIISDFCGKDYFSSWKLILESENLELILAKSPVFIEAILSVIETMGNKVKYNTEELIEGSVSDLDFESFIRLLKKLISHQSLQYKLKRLIYVNKLKENAGHWEALGSAILE